MHMLTTTGRWSIRSPHGHYKPRKRGKNEIPIDMLTIEKWSIRSPHGYYKPRDWRQNAHTYKYEVVYHKPPWLL